MELSVTMLDADSSGRQCAGGLLPQETLSIPFSFVTFKKSRFSTLWTTTRDKQ
jgi:hypothetical protein